MRTRDFLLVVSPLFLLACSSENATTTTTTHDAGADVLVTLDATADGADAAPAAHFPAFTPEMPQIVRQHGSALTAAKIVTVTWSTDPNEALYQTFDDTIGATDYWKSAAGEYSVGIATSGGHVSIKDPPPSTMTDFDVDTFVSTEVAAAPANGWPVNDPQTIYMLYLPESVELTIGGQTQCGSGTGGYHSETTANNAPVAYGIAGLQCHSSWGLGVTQFATTVGSHELIEAATDPDTNSDPGWRGYDEPHWAWAQLEQYQDEVGDACEFFSDSDYLSSNPPYGLQRIWSNAAAKAGHNPCQPRVDTYFNVTPLDLTDITIKDDGRSIKTKGYAMKVGEPTSVDLGFYSDGQSPSWQLSVIEGSPFDAKSSPTLTIATTTKSGQDGDVGSVYITPNYASPASGTLVTAISTGSGGKHYMPFLIVAK